MPRRGFTRLFENLLDHPNISLLLNTDYREIVGEIPFQEMIYTGPIDEFFDFRFDKLPYRSVEFRHETHDRVRFQPAAVINYPNDHDYTRITEFKYITGQAHRQTSVVYEFPRAEGFPYYPIPQAANVEIYKLYRDLADATPNVRFVGRLAGYKYYNMDQVVAQWLTVYKYIVAPREPVTVRKEGAA